MKGLNTEEVEHVADLANLLLSEEEKKKFSKQLNDILADIDKIVAVDVDKESKSLYTPTENHDLYYNDQTEESLTVDEVIKNANQTSGDYITISRDSND